jgi:hypothetical protein
VPSPLWQHHPCLQLLHPNIIKASAQVHQ